MLTYDQAMDILRTARTPAKKLGNNTYLRRVSDTTIAVVLHTTEVVRIHDDGTYTLNSGGWRTVTTKDRLNAYSPASVSQRNHDWYVGAEPFYDCIRVDSAGQVVSDRLSEMTA